MCDFILHETFQTQAPTYWVAPTMVIGEHKIQLKVCVATSGVTGGGRVPPWQFPSENFCWPTGKTEARKKGKSKESSRKIVKGKVENVKRKGGGSMKWAEDLFFFPPCFFLFFHFLKPLRFVCFGCTKMGIFYWKKAYFMLGKSQVTLPPLKNIPNATGSDRF